MAIQRNRDIRRSLELRPDAAAASAALPLVGGTTTRRFIGLPIVPDRYADNVRKHHGGTTRRCV
jgi:hypothetical protein